MFWARWVGFDVGWRVFHLPPFQTGNIGYWLLYLINHHLFILPVIPFPDNFHYNGTFSSQTIRIQKAYKMVWPIFLQTQFSFMLQCNVCVRLTCFLVCSCPSPSLCPSCSPQDSATKMRRSRVSACGCSPSSWPSLVSTPSTGLAGLHYNLNFILWTNKFLNCILIIY